MPKGEKLRSSPLKPPFRIVLIEPEIPPNTGAVARTCAATGSSLHLVGKLGFRIDEQSVRRAGLDYWPLVDLHLHQDFDEFRREYPDARPFLFSSTGQKSVFSAQFRPGDALVFGKESSGLPADLLLSHPSQVLGIPTLGAVRSLNLSNAVAISLFQALNGCGAFNTTFMAE